MDNKRKILKNDYIVECRLIPSEKQDNKNVLKMIKDYGEYSINDDYLLLKGGAIRKERLDATDEAKAIKIEGEDGVYLLTGKDSDSDVRLWCKQ